MQGVQAKVIQELQDDIDKLKKTIETAGEYGRAKLKDIKVEEVQSEVPTTPEGKLDIEAWAGFSNDKQKKLHHRLTLVRNTLYSAADLEGPSDSKHIMHDEYASNSAIVAWAILGFLLAGFLLWTIASEWSQATGTDYATKIQSATTALTELENLNVISPENDRNTQQVREVEAGGSNARRIEAVEQMANVAAVEAIRAIRQGGATEKTVLRMVILLGALGGTIHLISSLVKFVGNRQLKRSWLLYYLAMPVTGAGLAPIVYMLLRVGLVSPSASTDGAGIADLNLTAVYAFAALTGLFARTATDKLSEVFRTAFRTADVPSKDGLGTESPPGSRAS